ncbi:MAG: flagellar biosynthesis protein FlhA [Christensenellales bacterium]
MKGKASDILIAVLILSVILLIVIPLPPAVMDLLLIINIALSLTVLLIALYIKNALEISIFPTLLLILTLLRLTLNISATKLILGNAGNAGSVIETFGHFVIGSNLVVGVIIFLIIVLVNFIVITKGSERVSEVAARFTLDAMPGKQMAIDADLNTGVISEEEAQQRRAEVQRESDFYGAMDGASKFTKGDAIIGIIITLINIVGGILIGVTSLGMSFEEVIPLYILAAVGNGLVSQIPALLVSTASGIIVTRAGSDNSFGKDVAQQLFSKPLALFVTAGMLVLMSLIPGLPSFPMVLLSAGLVAGGYLSVKKKRLQEAVVVEDTAQIAAQEKRKPESVTSLLQVDLIEMEFGYGILSLVDTSQGGDLLDRVVMIRRQCALELGIIVPVVRLRDNIQLSTNAYSIKIKGLEVAKGEVMLDHFLALQPSDTDDPIDGIETVDPTFGLPAVWVTEEDREMAELKGYTTIDAPSVIATHLMEIIKRHAYELLGRQQVQILLDNLKTSQPALVEEVVPKLFSIGEVQKILANLLKEGVSIRDMGSILEILGDYGTITRDLQLLTEYVRQGLKRAITQRFVPNGVARVITLDPALEQMISENIRQTEQHSFIALDPVQIQKILMSTKKAIENSVSMGNAPVVMTSPKVRKHFKQLTEQLDPELVVLSYNELDSHVEIYSDGVVNL